MCSRVSIAIPMFWIIIVFGAMEVIQSSRGQSKQGTWEIDNIRSEKFERGRITFTILKMEKPHAALADPVLRHLTFYPLSEILLHDFVGICHTLFDATWRKIVKQLQGRQYESSTLVQKAAELFLNMVIATCVGSRVAAEMWWT